MTMISTTSTPLKTLTVPKGFNLLLAHIRRLLDRGVAAIIAQRERQAALVMLRRLNDRELKDMGLYRGQIEETIAKAARTRLRKLGRT